MRLLGVLFMVVFLGVTNAHAYLETYSDDETQITAGDQNTNLYRLNAMGSLAMKKLKKIDEAIARNAPEDGQVSNITQIEELIDSQQNENKQILEQMVKKIAKTIAKPENLKISVDSELYRKFNALCAQNVKDAEVAKTLQAKLRRR